MKVNILTLSLLKMGIILRPMVNPIRNKDVSDCVVPELLSLFEHVPIDQRLVVGTSLLQRGALSFLMRAALKTLRRPLGH